jgi:hypothetical protein
MELNSKYSETKSLAKLNNFTVLNGKLLPVKTAYHIVRVGMRRKSLTVN